MPTPSTFDAASHASVIPVEWRGFLLACTVSLGVVLAFAPTFLMLAGLGDDLGTHRVLVLPLFVVMLWNVRERLSALPVRGNLLGLAGLALAGAAWLVGELTFTRLFTYAAVIAMIPLALFTALGMAWVRALSFPLAFLIFALPIRGPLVPPLVEMTAAVTEAALHATGIPVHREGVYFELPSGRWSIAEACSGIEYLSACLMFAALYAWTMFESNRKRVAFFLGAALLGIAGNWLRAYLTMSIAHLSGNRLLRDDHGTFGWLLFATLLFGYCAWGWRYRDALKPAAARAADPNAPWASHRAIPVVLALPMVACWPIAAKFFEPPESVMASAAMPPLAPSNILPDIAPRAGWSDAPAFTAWRPETHNPTGERVQSFEKSGRRVQVYTALFLRQHWNAKLVSEVNRLADADTPAWRVIDGGRAPISLESRRLDVKRGIVAGNGGRLLAWQWYWLDGEPLAGDLETKVRQLMARLAGRGDAGAWVAVYAPLETTPDAAAATLDEFVRDMGEALQSSLVAATQEPHPSTGKPVRGNISIAHFQKTTRP